MFINILKERNIVRCSKGWMMNTNIYNLEAPSQRATQQVSPPQIWIFLARQQSRCCPFLARDVNSEAKARSADVLMPPRSKEVVGPTNAQQVRKVSLWVCSLGRLGSIQTGAVGFLQLGPIWWQRADQGKNERTIFGAAGVYVATCPYILGGR